MPIFNCENKWNCSGIAIISSLILGIIAAFLGITAILTIPSVFFIVAFGIAVVYLAVTLIAVALHQQPFTCRGRCNALTTLLAGILGTILLSIVLLAVTVAATNVIGALLIGALVFFFALMIISTACLIKCLMNYNE